MLRSPANNTAIKNTIRDGAAFLRDNKVKIREEVSNDDGTVTLRGKTTDRFQFVTRPVVTIDPVRHLIVSCECDCGDGSMGLCRHTVALVLSIGEQIEVEPALSATELPSSAEEEITIRVLHERDARAKDGGRKPITGTLSESRSFTEPPKAEPEEKKLEVTRLEVQPKSVFSPPGICVCLGQRSDEDEKVCWTPNDTEQILHPNMGIIGTMGTGKTQFTKSLIYQVVRDQAANYGGEVPGILIFDYKGDYNETKQDFVQSVGARVLKPYRLPYNPLALVQPKIFKPLLPIHTANAFKDTLSKIYRLGPKQQQFLLECIRKAYSTKGIQPEAQATWNRRPPTLANVYDVYRKEAGDRIPDSLTAALSKLHEFQIFDDNPVAVGSIQDLMRGVVVIDLSGYDPDIQNLVVAITLDQFYARMMSLGSSATDGRYRELRQLILVDEADNFMQEDFPTLRKILKEGREFGVGTILSTQSLSHFIGGADDYSRYILTWVVHAVSDLKQKDVEYIFKLSPKSTDTSKIYAEIKELEKHHSVVRVANRAPVTICDLPFWRIVKSDE